MSRRRTRPRRYGKLWGKSDWGSKLENRKSKLAANFAFRFSSFERDGELRPHESAAQFRMDGPSVAGVSGRVGRAGRPAWTSSTNSSSCSPLGWSKSSSTASWNGFPERGRSYSVILKILLASLLVDHTGGINSSYYLIYFVPVVTAAMYFELWATLAWTTLTSAAYCSFVLWELTEYDP
jgi:hypothetical protein